MTAPICGDRANTARFGSDGPARLLAAMRLASPALPIGGFSYSQGLETAIDREWACDEPGVLTWIRACLAGPMSGFEGPIVHACCQAEQRGDRAEAVRLNELFLATRETREGREETLQMGYSLGRLLSGLEVKDVGVSPSDRVTLPWAWALAAKAFVLSAEDALVTYLWAWTENQVMVALKAVPLGQQAGQRMISALTPDLVGAVERARALPEQSWSTFAPGWALAGCWHEMQYSRMFRS
jgi:urease accessory protein